MDKMPKSNNHIVIEALFEYILIIFPICIYVIIEAIHKEDYYYFIKSPEWAIASIFLSLQGIVIFYKNIAIIPKKINPHFLGLLLIIFLGITIISLLNSYLSLDESKNGLWKIITRLLLFLISTIYYLILFKISKPNY